MANGFANRFLFCLVKRSKFLPHGGHFDAAELEKLSERIVEAVEFARKVGRVTMTDKAAAHGARHMPTCPPTGLDCLGLLPRGPRHRLFVSPSSLRCSTAKK